MWRSGPAILRGGGADVPAGAGAMHQTDDGHQRRATGEDEGGSRFARWIDGIRNLLEAQPQRLGPGDVGIVTAGLIGSAIQKVELVVGKAFPAQAGEKVAEEALRLWMRRIEQVIALAQPGIDQRRAVFGFEQPVRVSAGQL